MKLFLFFFLTVITASCTITKQRYSSGFHVEWKKRHVFSHASAESEKVVSNEGVAINLSETAQLQHETREPLEEVHAERKEACLTLHYLETVINGKARTIPLEKIELSEKDNTCSRKQPVFRHQLSVESRQQVDWGEVLSDCCFYALIILILLVIPPLLHSIVVSLLGFKNDTLFIVLEWLVWAAGIVGIIVFFSGLWTMILTCLGWNLLFALFGSAFVFTR